jgi:hypothetical protein
MLGPLGLRAIIDEGVGEGTRERVVGKYIRHAPCLRYRPKFSLEEINSALNALAESALTVPHQRCYDGQVSGLLID